MSDPVTPVLGAIAAVTSLMKAARTIGGYIRDFRHAPDFVSELQVEVEGFTITIEDVRRSLSDPEVNSKIASAQTNVVFSKARETLYQLQETLVKVAQGPGAEVSRLKWVYYEKRCRDLNGQLATYRGLLNAIIFAAHSESHRIHKELLRNILYMQDHLLVQFTAQAVSEFDGKAELVLSSASTSTKRLALESFKHSDATTVHKPSLTPTYDDAKAEDSFDDEVLRDPDKNVAGNQNCDPNCRCICHANQKIIPAELVKKRRASAPGLIARFVRACTLKDCGKKRRRSTGSVAVPSQVINRALGIRLLSKGFSHLFILKTYPEVSENSDQIRYAASGNLQGLIMLVQTNKATPNDKGPDGWSLLHTSSYRSHLHVVTWLIDMGADTSVAEVGTRKAADLARIRALDRDAGITQRQIADKFTKADFKYDFGYTPLHIAVLDAYDKDDKDRPSLSELLECVEDANNAPAGQNWSEFRKKYRDRSPLFGELIEEFREASLESKRKRDPRKPYLRIIDWGDDRQGWSPFHWAAYTGRLPEMELLCKRGANPFTTTNQQRNSLHQAAESKRPEIMKFVLSIPEDDGQWFDINHQDRWDETPLHVAVAGSSECVKMLLEKGARRDIRDSAGQVPLHDAGLAKSEERFNIVDALSSDQGPHINAQDDDDRPPIFNILDTPECVALLLSRGALPSLCDNNGRTAIHHACLEDQVQSLKLLLGAHTADLAVSFDKNRDTPLAKAFESKSTDCIIALLEVDAIGDMDEKDGLPLAHRAAHLGDAQVLRAALNHPSYVKGRKDVHGRTVEKVAMDAENYKGEVKDLIQLYESKGIRVDRKGKGGSGLTQLQQAGPSPAAEARMNYFAFR